MYLIGTQCVIILRLIQSIAFLTARLSALELLMFQPLENLEATTTCLRMYL